jgi:hypothetical protein
MVGLPCLVSQCAKLHVAGRTWAVFTRVYLESCISLSPQSGNFWIHPRVYSSFSPSTFHFPVVWFISRWEAASCSSWLRKCKNTDIKCIPILLAASRHKRTTYTDCCTYRIVPPDDEQLACSKHVEVNYRNKLEVSNATCWFILHRYFMMHSQQNIRIDIKILSFVQQIFKPLCV